MLGKNQEAGSKNQEAGSKNSHLLLALSSWAWLRFPAHSAAWGAASAAGTGLGRGCGRRGPGDGKDREQLIDVRARALLTGDAGCGGTDYSLKLCSTLTALVFEYGHRSVSVNRTAPGYLLSDYSGGGRGFQPHRTYRGGGTKNPTSLGWRTPSGERFRSHCQPRIPKGLRHAEFSHLLGSGLSVLS